MAEGALPLSGSPVSRAPSPWSRSRIPIRGAGTALVLIRGGGGEEGGQLCWFSCLHPPTRVPACGSGVLLFFTKAEAMASPGAPLLFKGRSRWEVGQLRRAKKAGGAGEGKDPGHFPLGLGSLHFPHGEKDGAGWAPRPCPVLTLGNSESPAHDLGTEAPALPEGPRASRPHPLPFGVLAGSNHLSPLPFCSPARGSC